MTIKPLLKKRCAFEGCPGWVTKPYKRYCERHSGDKSKYYKTKDYREKLKEEPEKRQECSI